MHYKGREVQSILHMAPTTWFLSVVLPPGISWGGRHLAMLDLLRDSLCRQNRHEVVRVEAYHVGTHSNTFKQ